MILIGSEPLLVFLNGAVSIIERLLAVIAPIFLDLLLFLLERISSRGGCGPCQVVYHVSIADTAGFVS